MSIGLLLMWFLLHTLHITFYGLNDAVKKADVAVVLGNKVELNGEPSLRLKSRLDRAVQLYQNKQTSKIIVSGGLGKEGFEEAAVMKKYLENQQIPTQDIITDFNGYTTYLTAKNTHEIMQQNNWQSVIIVSQFYHLSRCQLIFKKMNISPIYHAHAPIFEWRDIYSLCREFPAYYSYWWRSV